MMSRPITIHHDKEKKIGQQDINTCVLHEHKEKTAVNLYQMVTLIISIKYGSALGIGLYS